MSKKEKLEILADWLEKQVSDSGISDETIWDKMGLARSTFYRLKPKAVSIMSERLQVRQKAVEQVKTQEEVQAVMNGLKTKNERVMILQNEVDSSLNELATTKKLGIWEKVALRKVVRELQAEISKIQGDYEVDNKQKLKFVVKIGK